MTDDQETNGAKTFGVFTAGVSGPPYNELPALLDPEAMIWRSADAAVAVPSVLVYRSYVEIAILGRTRSRPLNESAVVTAVRRGVGGRAEAGGLQFGVRGALLDAGGARFARHEFSCTAWCQLPLGDLVIFAEWAAVGIERAEYRITQERLRSATERVTVLWTY